MTLRVYLPSTRAGLAALVQARGVSGPLTAHAVTDVLRREWPEADDEQWEYAALMAAAATSRELGAATGSDGGPWWPRTWPPRPSSRPPARRTRRS